MSTVKQIFSLVKQELRGASRTRYIVISFVLMPVLMWGMQGGVQLLVGVSLTSTQEGETIYIVNFDPGNGTHNYGETFLAYLKASTEINGSFLKGADINDTLYAYRSYSALMAMINDPEVASRVMPLVIIPENFTTVFNAFNLSLGIIPTVEMYTLPGGLIGSEFLQAGVSMILAQPPFTEVTVERAANLASKTITFPGEAAAASGFGAGFIGFISILIAVMAPAPFVSTSFAGEREKKTMESLLALPISRFNILFGKLLAGMVLVGIFAVMNMVGLVGFSFVMGLADSGDSGAYNVSAMYSIDLTLTLLLLVGFTMFLSAFVAIGIGISVASLTKDVRSAESLYSLVMMVPSLVVGMTSLFGALPEQSFGGAGILLYLIPWSHAIAILSKGLYPQTYASSAITGSIATDLIFHFGFLVVVIFISLYIASRVFERESILT
ncbi:MAG: ABC transporter permease subunit [Candidatus Hodarchaeales archaeon]|jgi:ABC-type Na+ efflux pump permease subunit